VFIVARDRGPCGFATTPRSAGQSRDRRAQVGLRGVPEFHDERMVLERVLNDAALDACAASMNQSHFAQARFVRRGDVLLDDRRDVARRERVEIDRVFDGYFLQDGYVAVTIVFIPPRTAKSPTTVMRRG